MEGDHQEEDSPQASGWYVYTNTPASYLYQRLTSTLERYNILRHEGTETPGSSPYTGDFATKADGRSGIFKCGGCDSPLYSSETKFPSSCGWPAFYDSIPGAVGQGAHNDGSPRDEIWCTNCGGHLGHVFKNEPGSEKRPTNERHCVNGLATDFEEKRPNRKA